MTELVPFQTKRKKTFPQTTTAYSAVQQELEKHFKKVYPAFSFGKGKITRDDNATVFGKQMIEQEISIQEFSQVIASVTSPTLLAEAQGKRNLSFLEIPMLLLIQIAKVTETKKPYTLLPRPYQKQLKRLYTAKETLEQLATAMNSKKRAKKYLRIMQKRLGIYTEKKPPLRK